MCARISRSPTARRRRADSPDSNDVHPELDRLASELRLATLNVVWRQWRALGAAAVTAPTPASSRARETHALIDPEALVLISLLLMRDERRLADLLHDWAARNSDLLSVQRMKNLEPDYPDSVRSALRRQLAWFALVARDVGKDLRWRTVAQTWTAKDRKSSMTGQATGDLAVAETPSVRSGTTKSRAMRARLTNGVTLLLRLRLGFGVGVKADTLAFLLARADEWATVRQISGATAYTPAAVRRAVEDLAAARLIQAREGYPASYRVTYDAWAQLLEIEGRPPRWGSWHERFVFTVAFLQWAEAARERPLSRYALGAKGRELLEQHRAAFEHDHLAVWSQHTPVQDWAAFLGETVRSLVSWMEAMA